MISIKDITDRRYTKGTYQGGFWPLSPNKIEPNSDLPLEVRTLRQIASQFFYYLKHLEKEPVEVQIMEILTGSDTTYFIACNKLEAAKVLPNLAKNQRQKAIFSWHTGGGMDFTDVTTSFRRAIKLNQRSKNTEVSKLINSFISNEYSEFSPSKIELNGKIYVLCSLEIIMPSSKTKINKKNLLYDNVHAEEKFIPILISLSSQLKQDEELKVTIIGQKQACSSCHASLMNLITDQELIPKNVEGLGKYCGGAYLGALRNSYAGELTLYEDCVKDIKQTGKESSECDSSSEFDSE